MKHQFRFQSIRVLQSAAPLCLSNFANKKTPHSGARRNKTEITRQLDSVKTSQITLAKLLYLSALHEYTVDKPVSDGGVLLDRPQAPWIFSGLRAGSGREWQGGVQYFAVVGVSLGWDCLIMNYSIRYKTMYMYPAGMYGFDQRLPICGTFSIFCTKRNN